MTLIKLNKNEILCSLKGFIFIVIIMTIKNDNNIDYRNILYNNNNKKRMLWQA